MQIILKRIISRRFPHCVHTQQSGNQELLQKHLSCQDGGYLLDDILAFDACKEPNNSAPYLHVSIVPQELTADLEKNKPALLRSQALTLKLSQLMEADRGLVNINNHISSRREVFKLSLKAGRGIARTGDVLAQLRKLIKILSSVARSNVWLLEGVEANTGKPLRILFAGGDRNKNYISELVFDSACRETSAGKLYIPHILYLLHRNSRNCDLAIIEGHHLHQLLYQGAKDFYMPLWVESCVELPLKATSKGAKEDLRRARKHQLTYELSTDVEVLRDFYNNMYLTTIQARHGEAKVSSSFEKIASVVNERDNTLLLIKHGETTIAGVVIQMLDIPRLWIGGIRNSSDIYRRMGAVGATYHFPAEYLAERGYQQMSLGRSRSFLNDGVMQYKGKWNHHLTDFDTDGLIIKVLTMSDALSGFLTNQPFTCVVNGELHATAFVDSLRLPNERALKEISTLRSLQGFSSVDVFALDRKRGTICMQNKWPTTNHT